jgi:hypothetical protein
MCGVRRMQQRKQRKEPQNARLRLQTTKEGEKRRDAVAPVHNTAVAHPLF